MEINVIGQGEKKYKPDQIVASISISNVYKKYEEALARGEESVLEFLSAMKPFGFEFENFKTVNYHISDEISYSGNERKKTGVRYFRNLVLKFDYDMKKMANMLEVASKLKNAPKISVQYGLKDAKTAEMELFSDAYQNAKRQADIIANAAGLKVVKCAKANLSEGYNDYRSRTCYEMSRKESCCVSDIIEQTYTPQDVVIEQQLFCVFIAE